jgi:Luciferase-like monooxygenase
MLGLGSGYRPYEFESFGRDFEHRRDVQEEVIDLILELLHKRRVPHEGDAPDRAVLADGINLGLSCCLRLASTGSSAARLNPAATQPSRPIAPSAMTSAPTAAPIVLPGRWPTSSARG